MTESARTRQMYQGDLNPDQGDRMPRSLQESYNASRSSESAKISDEEGIEYDQEALGDAIEAYENFDAENSQALDEFGELFG